MALERLHKVLARAGFGSRRACEQRILAGEVSVDGKVVTRMGVKVDPARQKIKCGGQFLHLPQPLTFALHKPKNVVTTMRDERGRRTVMDLLRGIKTRVVPAGRLDAESQGLLILSNDGDLVNRLTHPRFRVPRTYHVVLQGKLDPKVLEKLSKGVWLSEGKTGPIDVRVKRSDREMTVVEVVVREGMNREVRRVFAKFGLKVKHLKRIRIGRFDLGSLPEGHFRPLGAEDIALLLGDSPAPAPRREAPRREAPRREAARRDKPEGGGGEEE